MHILYILIIMIVAGILGGLVNNFLQESEVDDKKDRIHNLIKSVIIGIAATFLVPLFLNMISSDLLKSSEEDYYKLFVYLGFCTVAAIASTSFINSMTNTFIKKVNEIQREVEGINRFIVPIADKMIEDDKIEEYILEDDLKNKDNRSQIYDKGMTGNEISVLKAIHDSIYVFRSIEGISDEIDLNYNDVKDILAELIRRDFVESIMCKKRVRYYMTSLGFKVFSVYNN